MHGVTLSAEAIGVWNTPASLIDPSGFEPDAPVDFFELLQAETRRRGAAPRIWYKKSRLKEAGGGLGLPTRGRIRLVPPRH